MGPTKEKLLFPEKPQLSKLASEEINHPKVFQKNEALELLSRQDTAVIPMKFYSQTLNPYVRNNSQNIDYKSGIKIVEDTPQPEFLKKKEILKQTINNNLSLKDKIKGKIEFTSMYCMSHEEITQKAVIEITNISSIRDFNNSLSDLRLGCVEIFRMCSTCKKNIHDCTGHYGLLKLNRKFVHPLFINETIYVLRCICHYCGNLYLTEEFFNAADISGLSGKNRLKMAAELSDSLHSLHECPNQNITYAKTLKNGFITYEEVINGSKIEKKRSMDFIEKIFSGLKPEDLSLLGFYDKSHPKNFIIQSLLIPPPQARPQTFADGMIREDYLTGILSEIIKFNIDLSKSFTHEYYKANTEINLYESITAYMLGSDKKVMNKGEKDVALIPKLTKKDGLMRNKFMGKRVNYCGRTVAGPASKSNLGQLIIPKFFSKILTIPEKVTKYNFNRLKEAIQSGQAQSIISIKKDNEELMMIDDRLREKLKTSLQIGDVVIRLIQNGDLVLGGRQPTLHAESNLVFSAVIKDDLVIGLNSCVNSAFNADFDGDELNLHVIQEIKAQAESSTIANVKFHIMNVQSNRPMIAPAFNDFLSSHLMTMSWVTGDVKELKIDANQWEYIKNDVKNKITKKQWNDVINDLGYNSSFLEVEIPESRWQEALSVVLDSERKNTLFERCYKNGVNERNGRSFFSLAFPVNFCYTLPSTISRKITIENFDGTTQEYTVKIDNSLVIKDGILISGTLNKEIIGNVTNSLVQIIFKLYSIKETCRFINDVHKICNWFLMWHNYSIGYKDIDANRPEILNAIKKEVNKTQFEIYNLGPIPSDSIDLFFWKKKAIKLLDNVERIGANIGLKILEQTNPLIVMGKYGSQIKGTPLNTAQIVGSLGAQFIENDLPKLEFNKNTRTLPTFLPNDTSLKSLGYIVHSYLDSLTPSELFFHISAGRTGLITSSNSVGANGYTSRRIRKTLEDTFINCLGIVSTVDGRIFSYSFGDCLNPAFQIPTYSKKRGKVINFCDVKQISAMLNAEYENEL